jgi:hypothetical protein
MIFSRDVAAVRWERLTFPLLKDHNPFTGSRLNARSNIILRESRPTAPDTIDLRQCRTGLPAALGHHAD